MFGSTAPSFGATTQSSAGTLFGAGSAPSTTPAFGSNVTNSSAAGTLFGGSAAATTPAFGGFGAKPATNTFGATNTAGGLFGNTSQPATSTAGATGFGVGGGFGNTQPAASAAGTGFGGGFGTTPATSTANTGFGGGGFGATPTATSTAGGTIGFGGGFGTTPATSTASTGFGGGGFGATPAISTTTNTGFGGFGATPVTSTAGFGGFGATPATSTANTGAGGGFGTTPATSNTGGFGGFGGFGANTAKPTLGFGGGGLNTTTGFGNTGGSGNLFGNKPQTTGFGFGGIGQQQQQQQQLGFGQQPTPPPEKVWEDLAVLRAHWDPTSPLCHFKHYFYNKVSPGEAHLYVRPPNQDENLWNEAVRNNPDASCYVPVLAIGFDDVWKRMELQSNLVDKHQSKLKESDERLKQVQRQYTLDTSVKLEEYKRRHIDLSKRLLRLLRYAQVLRYKGFPLNNDETATLEQLNQMSNQTENPAHLQIKMLSIWNQLQTLKKKVQMQEGSTEVWRTINDDDKAIIAKILQDEQRGIAHVVDTVKKDTASLDDIETRLKSARYNK